MGRLDLVNEIFDEEVTQYIDRPGIINQNKTTSEYNGVGKLSSIGYCFLQD